MNIDKSIQQARSMGASDSDILSEIQNQNSSIAGSIKTALEGGADPSAILSEISKQNQKAKGSTRLKKIGSSILTVLGPGSLPSKVAKLSGIGESEFATGATKGLVSTLKSASSLGEKVLQAPLKAAGMEFPEKTSAERLIPEEKITPETPKEKAGFMAEQLGEFFIPVGGEMKAVKVLDKAIPEIARLAKTGDVGAKIIQFVAKSIGSGAEFAGKTTLQTGDAQKAKESGIVGLASPAIGKIFSVLGTGVTKILPEKLMSQIFKTSSDDLANEFRSIANNREINPTLAQEALKEGIFGSSKGMAVHAFQTLNKLEDQVKNLVKTTDQTITIPNRKSYIDLLEVIKNQYQKGFYSERAMDANRLIKSLEASKQNGNKISLSDGLLLKRFLDSMRNTSSFRMNNNINFRQSEFRDAANLIRNKLKTSSPEIKQLLDKERMYIQFADAIIDDAARRNNKQLLGLTDAIIGGGGIATGLPGQGLGAMAVYRGFQQPTTLTGLAQFLYKAGEKLQNVNPKELLKLIPISRNQ